MKIRVIISILLCRALRTCLRLLGRGGTALPGKAALRVCPGLLGVVSRGVKTVVVTGTNGKTTTSRIIEKMLEDANMRCFANRSGSNLIQGITADLFITRL
jgi:UDP-N-acetylmuramyl pentapeptide synthase